MEKFCRGVGKVVLIGNFGYDAYKMLRQWQVARAKNKQMITLIEAKNKQRQEYELNQVEKLKLTLAAAPSDNNNNNSAPTFWSRREICYSDLFKRLDRSKRNGNEDFFQVQELGFKEEQLPTVKFLTGQLFPGYTPASYSFKNCNLENGKFEMSGNAETYTRSFQLLSFDQSSTRMRTAHCGGNFYFQFYFSLPNCFSSPVLPCTSLYFDSSHIAIDDLLDPAKTTDERFDHIFGIDLALRSVQAFSVVDNRLSSMIAFPTVLSKLLLEYAK